MVGNRLLRSDKRYSDLKEKQKERIAQWMYAEFKEYTLSNRCIPGE